MGGMLKPNLRLRLMPMPLTTIANPSDIPAVIATDSTMDSTTTSTETGTDNSTETSVTTITTTETVSVIDGNFSKLQSSLRLASSRVSDACDDIPKLFHVPDAL